MKNHITVGSLHWSAQSPSLWQCQELPIATEYMGDGYWTVRIGSNETGTRRFATSRCAMLVASEGFDFGAANVN